jgi:predicted AAA+ superfamily ATPase
MYSVADSDLLSIAADWSFWRAEPRATVPRRIELPRALPAELALVVQGVRRSGKSTLMTQLPARYGLARERCLFLNFEDPRLAQRLDHRTLQALVETFDARVGPGAAYFLDEIQAVEGWQRWLRAQIDRGGSRRFVVSGSNAHLLSGELGAQLTGRSLVVEVFPFDLDEVRALRPGATVRELLDQGGFPGALQSEDGDRLRRAYFHDIVERDVRERVGARSSAPLKQLAQMVLESAGSELSIRRAAASIGVAHDTATLYLEALEGAYMVLSCPFFAWSERKRAARPRKYYPIDTGLRRAAVTRTGDDVGKHLECATFLALRRRFRDVYYWRGRGEVDFVVLDEGRPRPIQVSTDGPKERHELALEAFYEDHHDALEAAHVSLASFDAGLSVV